MPSAWTPVAVSIVASLCVASAPAGAGSAKKPVAAPGQPPSSIAHCLGAGPTLRLQAAEPRALLDSGDRDRVHAAMLVRYPMLRGHDIAPHKILLWHKSKEEWLYVSLSPADVGASKAMCFTATVAAADIDVTPALIQKYFADGSSPA